MTIKRNSSTKNNPKMKKPKTNSKDTTDYTKLLTSENVEEIETGDDARKPEKIKLEKKSKIIKKNELKTDKDKKISKKTKGKSTNKTGIF